MSVPSLPVEDADLVLQDVVFARVADGRLAARGTAVRVEYRRSGGRLIAQEASTALEPDPGTGLAALGTIRIAAPQVAGEVPNRRGTASGGVDLHATRGDRASAQTLTWDGVAGQITSNQPVQAQGPGYDVAGHGVVARDDGSSIQLVHGTSGRLSPEAGR